jgi:hypothetical protein
MSTPPKKRGGSVAGRSRPKSDRVKVNTSMRPEIREALTRAGLESGSTQQSALATGIELAAAKLKKSKSKI